MATFLNLIAIEGGDANHGYQARRNEPPLWEAGALYTHLVHFQGQPEDFLSLKPLVHPAYPTKVLKVSWDCGRGLRPWWEDPSGAARHVGMHLQGRRWGAVRGAGAGAGAGTANAFESHPTFASYGVAPGDLSGLLAAMPAAHMRVLASLELVVEAEGVTDHENPQVRRLVAVHAGLESDRPSGPQVAALRTRRVDRQWMEALHGRSSVLPLGDLPADTLLASGHHGVLKLEGRRLVVDACAGHADRPLAAVVLPERRVVRSRC
jgi:hypothetical protein